jgi:hypothetical protein
MKPFITSNLSTAEIEDLENRRAPIRTGLQLYKLTRKTL